MGSILRPEFICRTSQLFTASKIKNFPVYLIMVCGKQFCLRNKKKRVKTQILCEDRTHDLHISSDFKTYAMPTAPMRHWRQKRVIKIYLNIFQFFFPLVHQTQKLYQFINPGSSLLLPKRKHETKSATYISPYNICIYVRESGILAAEVTLSQGLSLTLGDHRDHRDQHQK